MATSSDFLSENQFRCSICLDIFTDPVSTPCGHTFCKACLTRHWAGKRECQCPLCNNKFDKDLKLSVNTTFREVVDNFKKHHPTADATSLLKPWEVSCDVCPANKLRASRTCLVCLASFCETHLEPHLRVAALQRHKLSNPVPNLEEKICREHNRIVEFFCLNDHIRLCALCTGHSDHDTVSLNEAYIDQRSHIWRRSPDVKSPPVFSVQKTEQQKNKSVQSKKKGKEVRRENVKAQTTTPHHFGCNCMFHNQGIIRGKAFHNIQVQTHNECDLAAVRESTLKSMTFPPSWDGRCIARFRVRRDTRRIMVLIDYDYGLVLFFDPDHNILIHKLTGSQFNEPIALCFVPSQCDPSNCLQTYSNQFYLVVGVFVILGLLFYIILL